MDTIFVQIASYRDPECEKTVQDLFAKAKHPERISVGICLQDDHNREKKLRALKQASQIRFSVFPWQESEGVCWARHQAQQLWNNEDYVLSIDSHTRFAAEWDELLIEQLAKCGSDKPVLSNHPAGYTPPNKLQAKATPTILRADFYSPQGDLPIRSANLDKAADKPLQGAFCSGKFIFAGKSLIREVPYDPYMYAGQEDISLSARLFTHGFDVYSLKNVLLYHYYRNPKKPDMPHAPRHQDDNPDWLRMQERARKRLNHLLGHTVSENPEIIRDIKKYGLGKARSLEEYEKFCDIHFKKRSVGDRALRCGFISNLKQYLRKPVHIPEIDDVKKTPSAQIKKQTPATSTFNQQQAIKRLLRSLPKGKKFDIDHKAPEGIMIIKNYIDQKTCNLLMKYADSQAFTNLTVVDPQKSTKEKIVSMQSKGRVTNHIEIDGMAGDILTIFNNIYCNTLATFYDVNFEWYERPQILRYPAGGKYDQHADSEHWIAEKKIWVRSQDRDYSVLLYLNDKFEGGELKLINQDFSIRPKPGMLIAFPSDNRYLHAALPTTSGLRYCIVSWAAIVGSPRIMAKMPFAAVYVRQKRGTTKREAANG
jgi:hypothetical protein